MQSIIHGWKRFRPHLLAPIRDRLEVKADVLKASKPVYERRPPWWARFTYTFIVTDLVVTAAMAELAFNTWTEEKKDPVQEGTKTKAPASDEGKDADDASKELVPRPLWQRLPMAGAQMAVGVGIAFMILTFHARVARRLYVFPSSSLVQNDAYAALDKSLKGRFLLVEGANRVKNVFPLDICKLERVDNSEMKVHIQGIRGNIWVGMPGALVNGEKATSTWHVQEALYDAIYGKDGKKIMARETWNMEDRRAG